MPDIQPDAAPVEVCDARPHTAAASSNAGPEVSADILHMEQAVGQYMPDIQPDTAPVEVSADILCMEQTVGNYIRDAGNPAERDLYHMLKKLGKQYTQKQIRIWKQHYGQKAAVCAETAPSKSSHQLAAAV